MSHTSLFQSLQKEGQLLSVNVDDVQVLVPSPGKRAIGTQGLNGCTCIVMLGHAILLAHISPLPGPVKQWEQAEQAHENVGEAGRKHLASSLADIGKVVKQHGDRFPATTTVWGIFCSGVDKHTRFVMDQSREFFDGLGYDMKTSFYQEIASKDWRPPKGEVVAFYNRNGEAELIQESERIWPPKLDKISGGPTSERPSTSTIASTSSPRKTKSRTTISQSPNATL